MLPFTASVLSFEFTTAWSGVVEVFLLISFTNIIRSFIYKNYTLNMSFNFGQSTASGGLGQPPAAKPATTSTVGFGSAFGPNFSFGSQPSTGFGAPTASVAPQPQPQATPAFSVPSSTVPGSGSLFVAPGTQPVSSVPQTSLFTSTQPSNNLFGSPSLASTAPPSTSSGLFSGLSTSKPGGLFSSTPALGSVPPLSTTTTALTFPSVPASSASFTLGGSNPLLSKPPLSIGTAEPNVGLGGVDTTTSSGGVAGLAGLAGSSNGRPETRTVKENPIPDEVSQGVESFRQFIKQQKSLSCEVARCSSKPLLKVEEDTEAMRQLLVSSTAGLQRCRSIADKLKADTAKGLQYTEMAQRTHDTPPGLQYDNTAPLQYFADLVSGFEKDIQLFRQEIENAERHVHSRSQLTSLTPADLTQSMRRLYDSFVALASRLHTIHSQVKSQKEQYLSLRRYILNDTTDVFEEAARTKANENLGYRGTKLTHSVRSTAGPTPFSALNSQQSFNMLTAGATPSARPTFPSVGPLGWSSSMNTTGNLSAPSQPLLLSPQPDSSQFQLQKPPTGNKRGKR